MQTKINFTVNGIPTEVTTDPERPLLEVLREDLRLTGAKLGCGEGRCGACTVLVDGRSLHTCTLPVANVAGRALLTIEGLAEGNKLHPVQEAFLEEGALQCGFCTPGMILTTVDFLSRRPEPREPEIRRRLEGNLCRCCGYPKIVTAILRAAELMKGGRP